MNEDIGLIRATLFARIPLALESAKQARKDRATGQLSLFDAPPAPIIEIEEKKPEPIVYEPDPILPPKHLFPLDKDTGTRTCPRCGFVLGSGKGVMPTCK